MASRMRRAAVRRRAGPGRAHDGAGADRLQARGGHRAGVGRRGWQVTVDVLELARVPNTTDVIGAYVVQLDEAGGLRGYRRAPLQARPGRGGVRRGGAQPSHAARRSPLPGRPGQTNLADILERVLDKGIVIAGDIQINLLDIELLTIKLRLLIASVDRAREMGINWWESDPSLQTSARASDVGRASWSSENRELRERLERLERQLGVGTASGGGEQGVAGG